MSEGDIQRVVNDVHAELSHINDVFGPYSSMHEAYGVIREELDEFWDQVKFKQDQRSAYRIYTEAKQVAATAMLTMLTVMGELKDDTET